MKQLFKCTTRNYNDFYVVAENWQKATEYLEKVLNKNDYGYTSDRTITKIELIAVENISEDKQYFFDRYPGHLLVDRSQEDYVRRL